MTRTPRPAISTPRRAPINALGGQGIPRAIRGRFLARAGVGLVVLMMTPWLVWGQREALEPLVQVDSHPHAVAAAASGDRIRTEALLQDAWRERCRDPAPIALDLATLCLDDGRLGDAMVWALRAHREDPRSPDARAFRLHVKQVCGIAPATTEGTLAQSLLWLDSAPRTSWAALVLGLQVLGAALILIGRRSKLLVGCGISLLVIAAACVVRDSIRSDDDSLAVIVRDGVTLRADPHGERLGGRQLRVGAEVHVLGSTDTWAHVKVEEAEGYVERSSLRLVNETDVR